MADFSEEPDNIQKLRQAPPAYLLVTEHIEKMHTLVKITADGMGLMFDKGPGWSVIRDGKPHQPCFVEFGEAWESLTTYERVVMINLFNSFRL